jgi:hypothetical protein
MGAWAKATSGTPIRQVISHDNGGYDRSVGIDFRGGGTGWTAFAGTGSVLGFQPLTLDEWTFLAVVYDQTIGSVTLYVNGVAFSGSATLGSGNTFTRIGMNPAFGEYFQGSIDNVFFFGDALSPAAINQIRTGGAAAIVPEPSVITSLGLGIFLFATYLRRSKQTRR